MHRKQCRTQTGHENIAVDVSANILSSGCRNGISKWHPNHTRGSEKDIRKVLFFTMFFAALFSTYTSASDTLLQNPYSIHAVWYIELQLPPKTINVGTYTLHRSSGKPPCCFFFLKQFCGCPVGHPGCNTKLRRVCTLEDFSGLVLLQRHHLYKKTGSHDLNKTPPGNYVNQPLIFSGVYAKDTNAWNCRPARWL